VSTKILKTQIGISMTLVKVNNSTLQRPFSSLLDEVFNELPVWGKSWSADAFSFPPTNIHETSDAYHLELNVPGRSKEDIAVNVEKGVLTVSFEKKEEKKAEDYKTVRREFSLSQFKRSFTLDDKVDTGNIQAKYENGLLKLLLPKKAEAKENPRQININ
jgi:HSP20 family protein